MGKISDRLEARAQIRRKTALQKGLKNVRSYKEILHLRALKVAAPESMGIILPGQKEDPDAPKEKTIWVHAMSRDGSINARLTVSGPFAEVLERRGELWCHATIYPAVKHIDVGHAIPKPPGWKT